MLNKFFTDKQGKVVIFQAPNVPIVVWAVSTVAARLTEGQVRTNLQLLSFVAIVSWAVLEIGWGASYFRRALGLAILTIAVASRYV